VGASHNYEVLMGLTSRTYIAPVSVIAMTLPSARRFKVLFLQAAVFANATKEIGLRVRSSRFSFEYFCVRTYADYMAARNDPKVVSGVAVMLPQLAGRALIHIIVRPQQFVNNNMLPYAMYL